MPQPGINQVIDLMMRATHDGMTREEVIAAGVQALYFSGYRIIPGVAPDNAVHEVEHELRQALDKLHAEAHKNQNHHPPKQPFTLWPFRIGWRGIWAVVAYLLTIAVSLYAIYWIDKDLTPDQPSTVDEDPYNPRPPPTINWGGRQPIESKP